MARSYDNVRSSFDPAASLVATTTSDPYHSDQYVYISPSQASSSQFDPTRLHSQDRHTLNWCHSIAKLCYLSIACEASVLESPMQMAGKYRSD